MQLPPRPILLDSLDNSLIDLEAIVHIAVVTQILRRSEPQAPDQGENADHGEDELLVVDAKGLSSAVTVQALVNLRERSFRLQSQQSKSLFRPKEPFLQRVHEPKN